MVIRVQCEKSDFNATKVIYIGYMIDASGIHPIEERLQTVTQARSSSNVSELRAFIGGVNLYAKFIPNPASLLSLLCRLLKEDVMWLCGPQG